MRCLHCGRKLSFLRKLSDGKFCSDAHCEAHRRSQDELALARLVESQTGRKPARTREPARKTPGRADAVPSVAPLLPEPAVWARWGRLVWLPLSPEGCGGSRFLPESGLRPAVGGCRQSGSRTGQPPFGRRRRGWKFARPTHCLAIRRFRPLRRAHPFGWKRSSLVFRLFSPPVPRWSSRFVRMVLWVLKWAHPVRSSGASWW